MALQAVGDDPGLELAEDLAPTSRPGTRGQLNRWQRVGVGLGLPALLLLVWSLAAASGVLSDRLLPPPAKVLASGRDFIFAPQRAALPGVVPFSGSARIHVAASLRRWSIAYAIAVAIG